MPAVRAAVAVHLRYSISLFIMPDNAPFSFAEAEEIAEDFEDLVDTEFTLPEVGQSVFLVDAVAVCPFGNEERERFLTAYYNSKDALAALDGYPGPDYDVLLLLSDADDETNYSFIDIRAFVANKGINYNFPVAGNEPH